MTVGAIIVAAGQGERFGADLPKALVPLADMPLVCHARDRLVAAGVSTLVVVAPPTHTGDMEEALAGGPIDCIVVSGGDTRGASVRAGLAVLPDEVDVVAIHDAARALTPPETIKAAISAVEGDVVAAAPARPVADTIKRVDGDTVLETLDRAGIVAVQTPQVFRRDILESAHALAQEATDDLALVEDLIATGAADGRVVVTPGSVRALKITFPEDLAVAIALEKTSA